MAETFELKVMSHEGVEHALEKARAYRLLNQPEEAESLCLDILELEPDNQQGLIIGLLSLTDQYADNSARGLIRRSKNYVSRLHNEYHRHYYTGIMAEREGRAMLNRGMAREFAYDCFREAMHFYEKAEAIRSEGDDDAILRWNSCARTIMKEKLCPPSEQAQESFLE